MKEFKEALDERDTRATKRAYNELIENQQNAEKIEMQEESEAEDELDEGFEAVEDAFGVDLTSGTERANKLQKAYVQFLQRIEPRGGYQEYPDFVETFEVFKKSVTSKPSTNTAKALASRGMETLWFCLNCSPLGLSTGIQWTECSNK